MFECLDNTDRAVDDSKERTEEPQDEEEDVVTHVRRQAPGWGTAGDRYRGENYINTVEKICTCIEFYFTNNENGFKTSRTE